MTGKSYGTVYLLWAAANLEGVYATEELAEEARQERIRLWRTDRTQRYLIDRLEVVPTEFIGPPSGFAVATFECHALMPDGSCASQGAPCDVCPRACARLGCGALRAREGSGSRDSRYCLVHGRDSLLGLLDGGIIGRDTRKPDA